MLDDPKGKMATFYNNPDVQKALNVDPGTFWIECIPGAGRRRLEQTFHRRLDDANQADLPGKTLLAHDKPESVVPYVADLLDDAGIRVLIYNGDRDMTTNSQGSEMLLDQMKWDGAAGWSNTADYERGLWLARYDATTVGGYMKQYRNLEFLVVINSGHLVPFNRPQLALELITRFLGNESFIDKPLPKYDIRTSSSKKKDSYSKNNTGASTPSPHAIYSAVKMVTILAIGFLVGFYSARKLSKQKRRHGYDYIHNSAEMS